MVFQLNQQFTESHKKKISLGHIGLKQNKGKVQFCYDSTLGICEVDNTWIAENLFTKKGREGVNARVCLRSWWENRDLEKQYNYILQKTSFLDKKDFDFSERLYCFYNGLTSIPLCKNCKEKECNFSIFSKGYYDHCSNYCMTQSEERNDKIKKNNNYESIQEILKNKNLSLYGVKTPFLLKEYQEFLKIKKFEKYGKLNANYEQVKQTNLKKYGAEYYYQSEDFKEKSKQTKLEKYGNPYYNGESSFSSKNEIEILNYLNSLGFNFKKRNDVLDFGMELDGYDENLKIAFEHNGLYWHSELRKKNFYHKNKQDSCLKKGIKLYSIFEDEWSNRKIQVQEFLKASLGKFEKRIYARDCKFVNLDKHETYEFFDNYHIQGKPSSVKYRFGLKYENEIVGAISFSLHHRNNKDLVLNRLAFKSGIQIVGGASKLIKNSVNELKSDIITWSDNRWSTGMVYLNNGFQLEGELKPDYSYTNFNLKRYSKQSFKKDNIGCPSDITEHNWAKALGYYRIYDCGKKRWKYSYKGLNV